MRTLGDNDAAADVLLCLQQTEPQDQVLCTANVLFGSAKIMISVNAAFFKFVS